VTRIPWRPREKVPRRQLAHLPRPVSITTLSREIAQGSSWQFNGGVRDRDGRCSRPAFPCGPVSRPRTPYVKKFVVGPSPIALTLAGVPVGVLHLPRICGSRAPSNRGCWRRGNTCRTALFPSGSRGGPTARRSDPVEPGEIIPSRASTPLYPTSDRTQTSSGCRWKRMTPSPRCHHAPAAPKGVPHRVHRNTPGAPAPPRAPYGGSVPTMTISLMRRPVPSAGKCRVRCAGPMQEAHGSPRGR